MCLFMFQFPRLALVVSVVLYRFLPQVKVSDQTTGMIFIRPRPILTPVESLLVALDLQDGGVVVQDGQNDFVHVLSQSNVDFFLLFQGFH